MSMGGYLDERDDVARKKSEQAGRDAATLLWLNQGRSPEERLISFDRWLMAELDARLDWAWAGSAKEKRQHQCRIQIDRMILELWRRGWMLDGQRLAARVREMLDAIGKYQRAGAVLDFWPYFKSAVSRYVGLNAEDIQAESMAAGLAVGQVFDRLLRGAPAKASIPELIAQRTDETIREKIARARKQKALKQADSEQMPLL